MFDRFFGRGGPPPPLSEVVLHIYDLADSSAIAGVNIMMRAIGTGAFHAGVELHFQEWSFGCSPGPHASGIFCCPPRHCGQHSFRESVPMGVTSITEAQAAALIDQLALEWPASSYDLLRRNCCHFSDELCCRLGVGHVPSWVTSLAGVGAVLRSNLRLAVGHVKAAAKELGDLNRKPALYESPLRGKGGAGCGGGILSPFAGMPVGAPVEVFSISHGAWLPGRVESHQGTVIVVAFMDPFARGGELARKVLQNPTMEELRLAERGLDDIPEAFAIDAFGPCGLGFGGKGGFPSPFDSDFGMIRGMGHGPCAAGGGCGGHRLGPGGKGGFPPPFDSDLGMMHGMGPGGCGTGLCGGGLGPGGAAGFPSPADFDPGMMHGMGPGPCAMGGGCGPCGGLGPGGKGWCPSPADSEMGMMRGMGPGPCAMGGGCGGPCCGGPGPGGFGGYPSPSDFDLGLMHGLGHGPCAMGGGCGGPCGGGFPPLSEIEGGKGGGFSGGNDAWGSGLPPFVAAPAMPLQPAQPTQPLLPAMQPSQPQQKQQHQPPMAMALGARGGGGGGEGGAPPFVAAPSMPLQPPQLPQPQLPAMQPSQPQQQQHPPMVVALGGRGGGGEGPCQRPSFLHPHAPPLAAAPAGAAGRGFPLARAGGYEDASACGGAQAAPGLLPGLDVEVYSKSKEAWCPGHIESRTGNLITVAFLLPGAGPGEYSRKVTPAEHEEVRRRVVAGGAGAGGAPSPPRFAAAASPPRFAAPAPQGQNATSTSSCTPCAAPVAAAAASPGAQANRVGPYSIGTRVEVFSQSKQVWCDGHVDGIAGNMLTVAYSLPGALPDQLQMKELPWDHQDIRKKQVSSPSRPPAAEAGASPYVQKAAAYAVAARAPDGGAPRPAHGFCVGDFVEVYSNSKQVWCQGRVTKLNSAGGTAMAHVAFQWPEAPEDEWVEKIVPLGRPDLLRKCAPPAPSLLREDNSEAATAARAASDLAFQKLMTSSHGSPSAPLVGQEATLDANLVAQYLATSGLPRKALKEVWSAAGLGTSLRVGAEDFLMCRCLVAHCQDLQRSDASRVEAGGDALRTTLVDMSHLRKIPARLPSFLG